MRRLNLMACLLEPKGLRVNREDLLQWHHLDRALVCPSISLLQGYRGAVGRFVYCFAAHSISHVSPLLLFFNLREQASRVELLIRRYQDSADSLVRLRKCVNKENFSCIKTTIFCWKAENYMKVPGFPVMPSPRVYSRAAPM